jgi:hypothetical protein
VQPRGEVDLGVLGPAQLGHLHVPLSERQPLRLLFEVVEEVAEPVVPSHPRTLAGGT